MFLFGPLHVLILYAYKRLAGIIEFDEGVYEEIQRRAALVPPAQRQAAIDAMVKNRVAIGREGLLRKKVEERAAPKNYIVVYLFLLVVALMAYLSCSGGIH